MNEKAKNIAKRVKELREILEVSKETLAEKLNIDLSVYEDYENGKNDMPVSVLYGIASELRVDPTELMTGEAPRMAQYTVVRNGGGITVQRYKGYEYTSLASNIRDRDMEPMIVRLTKRRTTKMLTHKGQEFNYVLKGTILLNYGKNEITLNEGDSVYFDSTVPHFQNAVTDEAVFLTVINECAASDKQ